MVLHHIGGNRSWNGGILIQRNLTVSGGSDGVGGAISGITTIAGRFRTYYGRTKHQELSRQRIW